MLIGGGFSGLLLGFFFGWLVVFVGGAGVGGGGGGVLGDYGIVICGCYSVLLMRLCSQKRVKQSRSRK